MLYVLCIFNFMYNTHTFVIEISSFLPLFKKNIDPPSCIAGGFFQGYFLDEREHMSVA